MRKFSILLYFCLGSWIRNELSAQNPINAYAAVTAISGTTLTLGTVNETYHSFEDGDFVIIMQMQDDVIGTNTINTSAFGDLSSIQSAGLYEVVRIQSHTETASVPTSIKLYSAPLNTYHFGSNASVQLITYRNLGASYTSSASIGTLAWNGTLGGVTAMSVTNVFTLGHNITANGSGFNGGLKNTPNGYSSCNSTTFVTAVATRYARKGEGIYKNTNANFAAARGKILNGGGGGNDVNAGGGGGGNYLAGGGGGSGWTAAGSGCSPIAGGLGGLSLSSSISILRVFMGGGGGGGHENDGNGTVGGAGGGIVIVKAGTLTTVSCAGIGITANGVSATAAGNDGAGGGGAGGSVIMSVGTFSVSGACSLTVSANGGAGGNSNAGSGGAHGGGGGGGQGVVIYSGVQPTANVTTSTSSGIGGVSCSGCSSGVNGSSGSGPANSGIIPNGGTILPVELVDFSATLDAARHVLVKWSTAVEDHAKEFVLQRMTDENSVTDLSIVPATGSRSKYIYTDVQPHPGINYYRLKQVDVDGSYSLKPWVAIDLSTHKDYNPVLYPNPLSLGESLTLKCNGSFSNSLDVYIYDPESKLVREEHFLPGGQNKFNLSTASLKPGIYILKIRIDGSSYFKKLVISEVENN